MRPPILFPLFADIASLPGIGPKMAKSIGKLAGERIVDLLWHVPTGIVDRRASPALTAASTGDTVTLKLRVDGHIPGVGPRQPHRVRCSDGSGTVDLIYFHGTPDWLQRLLPVGTMRAVSGRLESFHDMLQIVHPDHVGPIESFDEIAVVEPVYSLSAGIPGRVLSKAIMASVDLAPSMAEWQDPEWVNRQGWPDWRSAVRRIHQPADREDVSPLSPARQRLAFDELLANQLAMAVVRQSLRRRAGRPLCGDGHLRQKVVAALPYALTGSQHRAVDEILADMASPTRMLRLLQGDVGSGKTVVGLLAMLNAVESGAQAALLAPTEILARQHLETIEPLATAANVPIAVLTGRDKGKARAEVLSGLADGSIRMVVGTHALIQDAVTFADLGLAVVDEQHRFGVHQRIRLSAKGQAVDLLVMTATPIPRSLQLTAYGDMEASRLVEKPPGRRPVDTRALSAERIDDVVDAISRKIADGAKVYWVCPLVEASETMDLAAAEERYAALRGIFGDRVGLIHGRMKGPQKDSVMAAFAGGDMAVLVATTVIEVGVDVPQATVMVIEHAERFGLAQLHQLRGRVGRGGSASSCLLLYSGPLGEAAEARIRTLRGCDDGFVIAEEDLRLRGAGEALGTRQSGLPQFRIADLALHEPLLAVARDDSRLILERDPKLESPRGKALRNLLYLFERDAAVRYLGSG